MIERIGRIIRLYPEENTGSVLFSNGRKMIFTKQQCITPYALLRVYNLIVCDIHAKGRQAGRGTVANIRRVVLVEKKIL